MLTAACSHMSTSVTRNPARQASCQRPLMPGRLPLIDVG